jgi:SSS family solute:Na+ symporter
MDVSIYVVAVFIAYFAAVLALGAYHARSVSNAEDFLVSGRNVGFWLLLGTILGTNVGGGTMVALTAGAYSDGVSALWPFLSAYLFIFVWALLFVRYVNRIRQFTLPDFLVLRFGERVRVPAAIFTMIRAIVLTGLQILAMASVMSVVLDLSLGLSMAISFGVTVVYCLLGGLYSVIVTDAVQTVLQTVGPIMLLVLVLSQVGNLGEVFSASPGFNPEAWNLLSPGWGVVLGLIAASGPYYLVYQPMWQRAYAARDEDTAYKSMLWGTVLSFVTVLIPIVLGIAANAVVPEGTEPSQVLPFLYLQQFPPLVGALFAVSLVGAIMSVLDSMVLDGTANLVRDVYQRKINPNATERQMVRVGRMAVVLISTLGLAMAIALPNLILLFVLANALAAGGLVIPAIAAWVSREATSSGAFWSIVGGGVATIGWSLAGWVAEGTPEQPFLGINAIYVGFAVGALLLVAVSALTPHSSDENADATLYRRRDLAAPGTASSKS